MEWYIVGGLVFSAMLVIMAIGVPVAVSLGLIGIGGLFFTRGWEYGLATLNISVLGTWDSFILVAVPMFVLMAELLVCGEVSKNLFEAAHKWFGALPGGLALATIGASAIFATMSGASAAAAVTIGVVAIPEMMSRGYDKALATGAVAAGGGLAHLIPPSLLFIIYAALADVSVGHLFMAGAIPGFILAGFFMIYILIICLRNPALAPRSTGITWKERFLVLRKTIPSLIIVLLVLGTIYTGIATPTESAGIGAFGALMIAIASRKMKWSVLKESLYRTGQVTCFIMLILVGGKMISFLLSSMQVPQQMMAFVTAQPIPPLAVVGIIMLVYVFLGCFIDGASMLIISVPVVIPMLQAYGFDLIWFGVLAAINVEMAVITPPMGLVLYAVKGIVPENVTLGDIIRGSMPYCISDTLVLLLVLFYPQLALWLPSKMLGG